MGARPAALLIAVVALLVSSACSDDTDDARDASTTTAKSSTSLPPTTATVSPGTPDPASVFPDTPIVAGQDATVNGTFSSGPNTEPDDDNPAEIGCQWVSRADGTRVTVQFPDVYGPTPADKYLIGPPEYGGVIDDQNPDLVHDGVRVVVVGPVEETDSACTDDTDYPGVAVVSSVWTRV